jgi:iron complex outermembrane receptor protein
VRAQALLQPNSNLTVRIIANYDHSDANCCITVPVGIVTHFADGLPYNGTAGKISILNRFAAAGYTLPPIIAHSAARRISTAGTITPWKLPAYRAGRL